MSYILALLFMALAGPCYGQINDKDAALALIGEFENDNIEAGACALANRGTLKGVYGIKSKRVVNGLYSRLIYKKAMNAWIMAQTSSNCQMVHGAAYWQSVSDMKKAQAWRDKCRMVYFSGKTYFYKCN